MFKLADAGFDLRCRTHARPSRWGLRLWFQALRRGSNAGCIKFSLAYVTGDDTLGQITINYSPKCSHSKENLENAITNVLNAARVSKNNFWTWIVGYFLIQIKCCLHVSTRTLLALIVHAARSGYNSLALHWALSNLKDRRRGARRGIQILVQTAVIKCLMLSFELSCLVFFSVRCSWPLQCWMQS